MKDPGRKSVQYLVGISEDMRYELRTRFANTAQHIRNLIAADLRKRPPLRELIGKEPEKVLCDDGWKE